MDALADWVLAWASSPYGALALVAVSFAESIISPIAPDPILMTMALALPALALLFAALATLASVTGGLTNYYIGARWGRPAVVQMFGEAKAGRVEQLYRRYDVWAIALAGFTPLPYKVFSISAGAFRIDVARFLIASLIGRSIRFFTIGALIYVFGEAVRERLGEYWALAAVTLIALVVAGFLVTSLWARRQSVNP